MICSRIVQALSDWWAIIGWGLFAACLLLPFFAASDPSALPVWLASGLLLILWWIVDVVDQQVPGWMTAVGLLMLGAGFLPRGGILSLACWVIYWTRVRE